MATFKIGQTLATTEPAIVVDGGLPLGRHLFRLVVVDDSRRESLPQDAIVEVRRLLVTDPLDRPLPTQPPLDGPILIDRLNRPVPIR